jgi:hypothetical protein
MRKCAQTQGNRESKDYRASASRVQVQIPQFLVADQREAAHSAGGVLMCCLSSTVKSM